MSSRRSRLPRIVAGLLAVLVLGVTAVGAGVNLLLGHLQGNITAVNLGTSGSGQSAASGVNAQTGQNEPLNLLLIGSDTRAGAGNGGFGHANLITGARSDTTILLHISADRKTAIGVSIPRDTKMTLPLCTNSKGQTVGGQYTRINAAFDLGGAACTIKAVNKLTGLNVDHFLQVDFGGFKNIVDALGGVQVCLAVPVNDVKSGLHLSAGTHDITGKTALAFVRIRHGISDGSDTSRIRRQQAFLSSVIRKISSGGTLLNPAKFISVMDAATKSLTADTYLANISNLQALALSMKNIKPSDITFLTLPWLPNPDRATVHMDAVKAKPVLDAIANDTPWPPKPVNGQPVLTIDPTLVRVNVLNGTGVTGAARKAAAKLKAEGFRIGAVHNVPNGQTYATTTLQYDPKWDQSAATLTYAANATQQAVTGQGKTMNLIIGANFNGVRPVVISKAVAVAGDANVNNAGQSFCAK